MCQCKYFGVIKKSTVVFYFFSYFRAMFFKEMLNIESASVKKIISDLAAEGFSFHDDFDMIDEYRFGKLFKRRRLDNVVFEKEGIIIKIYRDLFFRVSGREGIYEIMRFDPEVADLVRTEAPVSEIREFFKSRGGFLISHHAVEKVKKLIFPLKDVYERVLIEEGTMNAGKAAEVQPATPPPEKKSDVVEEELRPEGIPVLLVEDDADTQNLVARILQKEGYQVTVAGDGIDALMRLGEKPFDLILSDVNMPNLDGFKLLELMQQKGIHVPVILLTGRIDPEDEVRGLDLGAADYIKKPIKKEILLHRVRQALPAKRGGA